MKVKKIGNLFILFLFLVYSLVNYSYSQQSVNVSGGKYTGNGGSFSYSIGQVFFNQNFNGKIKISQGVQQPFEISFVIVGVEEVLDISSDLIIFPNPTDDFIYLKIEKIILENLLFHIYDLKGRLIIENKLEYTNPIISFDNLPSEIYFLKISSKNRILKTFKIVKNK